MLGFYSSLGSEVSETALCPCVTCSTGVAGIVAFFRRMFF